MARENDPVCLVCGRRCPGAEVLYVRPNGNTHQAVALCGKRCRRAYNGPREEAMPGQPRKGPLS